MRPDPLSPIAPLSSAMAAVRTMPLPEDRPVTAGEAARAGQTAQTQAAGATAAVEAPTETPTTPQTAPVRDPVAQAVIDGREAAALRQTSLAPLLADLSAAASARPSTTTPLPADVRTAIDQVLAQRLSTQDGVSAQALRDAVARSGLFLEANIATGQADVDATNDLKAALLNLRQTLASAQQALAGGTTGAADPAPQLPAPGATAAAQATSPQALAQILEQAAGQIEDQAALARPLPSTTNGAPTPSPAGGDALAVSQSSLLLAAQATATPETADILIEQAIQAAQRAQQQTQAQAQVEALRQTAQAAATAAAEAETAANTAAAQTTQITSDDAPPTAPAPSAAQTAAQNALNLAQQAAAQAAQLAVSSANAQRTINQSSLLLAAQAAAIKPEDDEPSPLPPRFGPAQETVPAVEPVTPATPPPPVRGSTLAGQPPPLPTLPTTAGEAAIVRHLAEQVDHALARQALHQLASVPGGGAEASSTATWMFEIPIATPQGTTIAQFEIERDGRGQTTDANGGTTWRARFSLNFEPLGPVHVQLSQVGPRTAVNLWAEREGSLDALHAQSDDLARDLGGEVRIQGGVPQQRAPSRGQFVDRLT